jgi:hypothetical protein
MKLCCKTTPTTAPPTDTRTPRFSSRVSPRTHPPPVIPGPDPGSMYLSSRAPTRDSCICHPGPRPGIHPPKTWTPDQVQGDSKKNGGLTPINVQRINRDLPPNESKQLEWL